jgi:hypothetical protein
VPGTYSVKATMQGFRPVEQRNIVVNADNTARADLELDASFRKAFRSGSRVLQPRVDLYNLANSATITSRGTTLGPSYDGVNAIQRGRLIKFGISLDF